MAPLPTASPGRPGEREVPADRGTGVIARIFASRSEIEAADEQRVAHSRGSTLAVNTRPRVRAEVSGVLRSVTYRPQDKVPALLAELYDGSGSVDLVWLGRRDVAGIQPGRRLVASGMVCPGHRRNTIFNPRYELAPVGGE
jgi:hypothetical protein